MPIRIAVLLFLHVGFFSCKSPTSTEELLNAQFPFGLRAKFNRVSILAGESVPLRVTGGTAPYTYSVFSGVGTVTQTGTFSSDVPGVSVVQVTDAVGATLVIQCVIQIVAKDPAQLPALQASLKLWLKADSLNLTDGDTVASWTDISGNGYHATQGTAMLRPAWRASVYNAKPVIRFSSPNANSAATNQSLSITMPNITADALTAFVVATPSAYANSSIIRGPGIHGSPAFTSQYNQRAYEYGLNDGGPVDRYIMQNAASGINLCTYVQANNRSAQSFFNGALQQDANAANSLVSYRFTSLGGPPVYAAEYPYNGDVAEVIIYYDALKIIDRYAIDCYLMKKYGIQNAVCI